MSCKDSKNCQFIAGKLAEYDKAIADAGALADMEKNLDDGNSALMSDALDRAYTILDTAASGGVIRDEDLTVDTDVMQQRLTGGYVLCLGQASLCTECPARAFILEPPTP